MGYTVHGVIKSQTWLSDFTFKRESTFIHKAFNFDKVHFVFFFVVVAGDLGISKKSLPNSGP